MSATFSGWKRGISPLKDFQYKKDERGDMMVWRDGHDWAWKVEVPTGYDGENEFPGETIGDVEPYMIHAIKAATRNYDRIIKRMDDEFAAMQSKNIDLSAVAVKAGDALYRKFKEEGYWADWLVNFKTSSDPHPRLELVNRVHYEDYLKDVDAFAGLTEAQQDTVANMTNDYLEDELYRQFREAVAPPAGTHPAIWQDQHGDHTDFRWNPMKDQVWLSDGEIVLHLYKDAGDGLVIAAHLNGFADGDHKLGEMTVSYMTAGILRNAEEEDND